MNFIVTDQARHFLGKGKRLTRSRGKCNSLPIPPTIHLTQLESIAKAFVICVGRGQCMGIASPFLLSRANSVGFRRSFKCVIELGEGCETVPASTRVSGVCLVVVKCVPHFRSYVGRYRPDNLCVVEVGTDENREVVLFQRVAF